MRHNEYAGAKIDDGEIKLYAMCCESAENELQRQ